MRPTRVSLLNSPFVLWQLRFRLAMGTLLATLPVLRSVLLTLPTLTQSRTALQFETLALRHQLEVLHRTRPRRVRLAKKGLRRPHNWLPMSRRFKRTDWSNLGSARPSRRYLNEPRLG